MNGIRRSMLVALASLMFVCAWSDSAWTGATARGAIMETVPLRALTAGSDVIVVAEPIDMRPPRLASKYRVVEVVRGAGIVAGDEITLNTDTLGEALIGLARRKDERAFPEIRRLLKEDPTDMFVEAAGLTELREFATALTALRGTEALSAYSLENSITACSHRAYELN